MALVSQREGAAADSPNDFADHPLASTFRRPSLVSLLALIGFIAFFLWALDGTNMSVGALRDGMPKMRDFLSRTWPPDFSVTRRALPLLAQTVQMALIGTMIAITLGIPLGLLAAQNISPHPVIYQAVRGVLNVGRTIPDLIIALAFVAAVGLGPFPGTLALGIGSCFSLSKLFAEAFEQINPRQVEAVNAVGGNRGQVITFGVLPQAFPLMVSYSLLFWESNIRSATILGLVGAGGIGLVIITSMNLFRYRETMAYVILLVVMVTLIDRFSAWVRKRFT